MTANQLVDLQEELAQWDAKYGDVPPAEDTSIKRFAPGPYVFEVVSQSVFKSNSGNIALKVMCKPVSGPETGGRLAYDFWCSENAWPLTMRDIRKAFGAEVTRRTDLFELDFEGMQFKATVEDDEYNGNIKSVMKWLEKTT